MSRSAARSSGDPYALVSEGRSKILIADFAASTLLFESALIMSFERPVALRRPGRWAVAAQEVAAVEDKPIMAVRRGSCEVAMFVYVVLTVSIWHTYDLKDFGGVDDVLGDW